MHACTAALYGEGMLYSFKCVCLPDVSCSAWPMLLGGDGEEEREHHPTRMRGGPLASSGKVGVCICMSFLCLSLSSSLPLLSPLPFLSPLPLSSPLCFPLSALHFPSSPPLLSYLSAPLLPPLPLLFSLLLLPCFSALLPQHRGYSLAMYSPLPTHMKIIWHHWCECIANCFNHVYSHQEQTFILMPLLLALKNILVPPVKG